ncbi:MAG: ABC transporter permease [Thermoproteota archaeon]|nr:MAG: ABC transporter permease [Candidatus Korarchaeota archaeon]
MVGLRLERREVPTYAFVLVPVSAFAASFLVGGLLMAWAGVDPLVGYSAFVKGAFGSLPTFADTLVRMVPFLLMGTGIALSDRANVLNIGAEGQLIVGALATTWICVAMQDWAPAPLIALLALALSSLAGGAWAGFAGYLKAKMGINEVVTTVMMNWLAFKLMQWLLRGPLKSPKSEMWPMSPPLEPEMPIILPGTRLHAGFALAVLLAVAGYYFLFRTNVGFKLRACGKNPAAARYAGYDVEKMVILSMVVSGAFAGLAGAVEVMGVYHFLFEGISVGLGYTAIIVALVGKDHPIAVIPSAFMFGVIYNGVVFLQGATGLTYTLSKAIEGMIYLFVLVSEVLLTYRIRVVRS